MGNEILDENKKIVGNEYLDGNVKVYGNGKDQNKTKTKNVYSFKFLKICVKNNYLCNCLVL